MHPVHLGVIFLANLELGFLTPPVGLNLFLSSQRFGKPPLQVYRDNFPFLVIRAIGVLLITYVPALSVGVLQLLGRTPGPSSATARSSTRSDGASVTVWPRGQLPSRGAALPSGCAPRAQRSTWILP